MRDHDTRLAAARRSLEGLSAGDAFGERFFIPVEEVADLIEARTPPATPWMFTDDTVMAISIVDVLAERRELDRDLLAKLFAARYRHDPDRGYGGTAYRILTNIGDGMPWQEAAGRAFDGTGSMGNGGAMRAGPIGAYFADKMEEVVEAALKSAEVTHAHSEGQAGAVAVAIAAAWATRGGGAAADLFETVLDHTPTGETWGGIERASRLELSSAVRTAVSALGNGSGVIAPDTVPFSLWCVARHLGDYEGALWTTVAGLGDRDTTCAIVGGIVAMDPRAVIPPAWIRAREPLENMAREHLQE